MQPKLPSIIKLPVNKRFEYNPVYHDPVKDEGRETISGREYRKYWSSGRRKSQAVFSLRVIKLIAIAVTILLLTLVFLK